MKLIDILSNKIIMQWLNYIKYLKKLKYNIVTSSKYANIIFYIIYLKNFRRKILSLSIKKQSIKQFIKLVKKYIMLEKAEKYWYKLISFTQRISYILMLNGITYIISF